MAKFNGQFNGSWMPLESDGSISGGTGTPGPQGPAGPQGPKGEDGVSPVISVQNIVGGHTVVITDVSGTKTFDVMNGQDGMTGPQGPKGDEGPAGERGAQGDPGLTGPEGPAGKDGEPGAQGPKGDDGFSPTVSISEIDNGHRVTITDKEGPHDFDVMNGESTTNTIIIGDTLIDSNGVIDVKTPVQGIMSQSDFDALPKEQQDNGTWIIPVVDGNGYLPSNDIYSEEEILIGTWIDGKPLYRKVILSETTDVTNTANVIKNVSELNIETVVSLRGLFVDSATLSQLPIGSMIGNSFVSVYYQTAKKNIVERHQNESYNNAELRIIIEYTKTTD